MVSDHNKAIEICWGDTCAYCHQKIVEILIDTQPIPTAILEECRYDCSPDIQALVTA